MRSVVRTLQLLGYFLRFGTELVIRRPRTRRQRAEWLHRFCATALHGLDMRLSVEGEFPPRGALIANHVGYLDIVVFAALHPCVFVSKAEIAHWPVLGWFATMAGTVFVERGAGGSAARAAEGMAEAADADIPVVFFPEGTTTDGTELLPFHSGLLAEALGAQQPVTAAFVHYTLTRDNGPRITVRNDVAYWGDASLLPHIVRFLGLRGAAASVRIAPGPVRFSAEAEEDRKQAAVEAREAILLLAGGELAAVQPPSQPAAVP